MCSEALNFEHSIWNFSSPDPQYHLSTTKATIKQWWWLFFKKKEELYLNRKKKKKKATLYKAKFSSVHMGLFSPLQREAHGLGTEMKTHVARMVLEAGWDLLHTTPTLTFRGIGLWAMEKRHECPSWSSWESHLKGHLGIDVDEMLMFPRIILWRRSRDQWTQAYKCVWALDAWLLGTDSSFTKLLGQGQHVPPQQWGFHNLGQAWELVVGTCID